MPTYTSRPKQFLEPQPAPALPHPVAYVSEPVKTGILDKDGREIYWVPDPIGFLPKSGDASKHG
jgi:hypothetical protein